jgi:hypothetical protein
MRSGEKFPYSILATYVITKPQTSGKDIRNALAKAAGDIPIDTPMEVEGSDLVEPSEEEVQKGKRGTTKQGLSLALNLMLSNDMIGLELDSPEENKKAAETLRLVKFQPSPDYFYTLVKTPQDLLRFFKAAAAKGFTLPKAQSTSLKGFYDRWSSMRKNAFSLFGQARAADLKNFYLTTHKPPVDGKELSCYLTVENDQVFLCLPAKGFKANAKVVAQVKVPNIRFYRSVPQLVRFFETPARAIEFIRSLLGSGTELTNDAELRVAFTKLHKLVPKVTKLSLKDFFKPQ